MLPVGAPLAEWHATRLTGLGGSDALAALALSPWSTPYALWLDKTGRRPPKRATGRLAWGHRLEPLVAEWFTEQTGLAVGRTGTWRHPVPLYDAGDGRAWWMLCNPDRFVIGEPAGVEIKTVDDNSPDARLWRDHVPDYPEAQAQWCMGVTGALRWYVVALIDGREPIVHETHRDDDLIGDLRAGGGEFCRDHLATDVAPPFDAAPATSEALAAATLAKITDARTVDLGERGAALQAERRRLLAERLAAKRRLDEISGEIKAALIEAGAQFGTVPDSPTVFRIKTVHKASYVSPSCEYVELREVKR